jgi:hypothetical protein
MLQERGSEQCTDSCDEGIIYCHRARSERFASDFFSIQVGQPPLFAASPFCLSGIAFRRIAAGREP